MFLSSQDFALMEAINKLINIPIQTMGLIKASSHNNQISSVKSPTALFG